MKIKYMCIQSGKLRFTEEVRVVLGTSLSESKAFDLTELSPPGLWVGRNPGYWAQHFLLYLAPEYWLPVSSVVCSIASNTSKWRVQKACPQKTSGKPDALRVSPPHCPALLWDTPLQSGILTPQERSGYVWTHFRLVLVKECEWCGMNGSKAGTLSPTMKSQDRSLKEGIIWTKIFIVPRLRVPSLVGQFIDQHSFLIACSHGSFCVF